MRLAGRIILQAVDLDIGPADRFAVVGDNGAGKSTLLGAIAGSVPLAQGERIVELPGGVAVAEQHPMFPAGATVADAIDLLLGDLRALEGELRRLADAMAAADGSEQGALMQRYADAVDRFEARDGYRVDLRVDAALEQLGLGGLDRRTAVANLSGGERARLALAAASSAQAELLLLDEPTNDLDDAGIHWLEQRLAAHRGALVVVTHDRHLLERFATDVLAIENGTVRRYGDGYGGYLLARATERQRALEQHRAWREDLARNESLIRANAFRLDGIPRRRELTIFGHAAFRARSRDHGAMSRIRGAKSRVASLRANPVAKPTDPLRFTPGFHPGEPDVANVDDGAALLDVSSVRMNPDGGGPRLVLDALTVSRGDRWLVDGVNGAGKTTLLRVLAGELPPQHGVVHRHPGLRIAWLHQELLPGSPLTACDAFAAAIGAYRDEAVETLLSLGLFDAADLERPTSALSVGQRRRLELAVAVSAGSDLLLLDEPTNHLSPDLTEQLEDALDAYEGAVITVTHDRRWRERAARDRRLQRLRVASDGNVGRG